MNQPPNLSHIEPRSLSGLDHLGRFLKATQNFSGAIPSNKNGTHDPWDHLEAIMGLATLGYQTEAIKGFNWMISNQNTDGSWYNLYDDQKPLELNKQTNYSSYLAVATWHFYLLNNDIAFLRNHWESMMGFPQANKYFHYIATPYREYFCYQLLKLHYVKAPVQFRPLLFF